jgi:Domain of unknown function (DUF4304)
MNRTAFLSLVARQFFPQLRAEGFVGSGATLRRINGPVLHVFNIQGSGGGEEFFINLGASLTFLQMLGVDEGSAATAKEYQCVFRHRLNPTDTAGRGWSFGTSTDASSNILERLLAAWRAEGQSWFESYATYPEDFRRLVDSPAAFAPHPAHMLTLARIALHLGDRSKCHHIAREALSRTSESATVLKHELSTLVQVSGAA